MDRMGRYHITEEAAVYGQQMERDCEVHSRENGEFSEE